MDRLEIFDLFRKIESEFDVNSLRYHGLYVWPLIKIRLMRYLEYPDRYQCNSSDPNSAKFSFMYPDPNQIQELKKYRGIDCFFFSRTQDTYSIKQDNTFYNSILDPVIESVSSMHSCMKLEFFSNKTSLTTPRYIPTLFLNVLRKVGCYSYVRSEIQNFDCFKKYLMSLVTIDYDERSLQYDLNRILQARYYFKDILSVIQPKVVLKVCYYGTELSFGLLWACQDLGISTVDLQHGHQYFNCRYQNWGSLPAKGYEMLPDMFYVWGSLFKDNIEKSHSADFLHHKAVVGTNLWLKPLFHENSISVDAEGQTFFQGLSHYEKVILITLQLPGQEPDYLLDAIKKSPKKWFWMIRQHPLFKDKQNKFVEKLVNSNLLNYDIQFSQEYPLYYLFRYIDHHVTGYSTCGVEALAFGIPTTFYSNFFKSDTNYLNGSFSTSAFTSDQLLESINHHYSRELIQEYSNRFFNRDKDAVGKAFERIINHTPKPARQYDVTIQDRPANLNDLGEKHFERQDFQNAAQCFINALELDPNNIAAYNNLAVLFSRAGQLDQALECLETALAINPSDKVTQQNYQELLQSMRQTKSASDVFVQNKKACKKRRIYHYHIRKTGGTSINHMFFSLAHDDPAWFYEQINQKRRMQASGLIYVGWGDRLIQRGDYFYGFSHIPAHELRLPDNTFTFTCLRDPIKRIFSHYKMILHLKVNKIQHPGMETQGWWLGQSNTLDEFLNNIPKEMLLNQLYMFSKEMNLNEAVERIASCNSFFFTENFNEGVHELSHQLNLPLKPLHIRKSKIEVELPHYLRERMRIMLEPEYRMVEQLKTIKRQCRKNGDVSSVSIKNDKLEV